jgi:hypothetical protein
MPDAPGFAAHQERLDRQWQLATRYAVVQHALSVLALTPDLTTLSYTQALQRLSEACQAELQRLPEEPSHGG